jgi:hypothetical protein
MTMQEHNEEVRFQIGEVTLAGTLGAGARTRDGAFRARQR